MAAVAEQPLPEHSGRAAGRKRARSARPGLEVLEGRDVPAGLYVDNLGDFTITTDQGAAGSITAITSPGPPAPAAPTAGRSAA